LKKTICSEPLYLEQVLWWAISRLNAEVEERRGERRNGLLAYSQLRHKNQDIVR